MVLQDASTNHPRDASTTTTTTTTTIVEDSRPPSTLDTDWSAYYDEEGRIYYYNSTTEESVWEPPPEGFHPPDNDDDDTGTMEEDHQLQKNNTNDTMVDVGATQEEEDVEMNTAFTIPSTTTIHDAQQLETPPGQSQSDDNINSINNNNNSTKIESMKTTPWIAYLDDEGREYYYHSETGETQWDAPEFYRRAEDEKDDDVTEEQNKNVVESSDHPTLAVTMDNGDSTTPEAPMDSMPENVNDTENIDAIPTIDPAVQRLLDAETAIYSPDSVLEPTCMVHVAEMVKADGGNASRAISALIDHYYGQTAVCGLLTRWYLDLSQHHHHPQQPQQLPSRPQQQLQLPSKLPTNRSLDIHTTMSNHNHHADHIRNVIQNVIHKISKEKYTKEAGDSILDLSRSDVSFLEDMMESSRWRTLLIDLSASYKDSAVLLYCLRSISKRGHHREIAQRINISDHFTVFNAMLLSELSVIGQQAISASSDIVAATTFPDLIQDVIKACTATSYTYLYSIQMLRTLIQMSNAELAEILISESSTSNNDTEIDSSSPLRFRRAILKWEAVLQLLEGSMVDPSNAKQMSGSSTTTSPLLRRRQLEVALTISDLHQRQRRAKRKRTTKSDNDDDIDDVDTTPTSENNHQDRLETAVAMLLKRYSMGIQIDDSVLDKLLPSGLDVDTCGVGNLLIQYPVAVQALLGHLYKPGPTRITSPSTKNKCARLIALSMFAAETSVKTENNYVAKAAATNNSNDDGVENTGNEQQAKNEITVTQQIVQGSLYCEQMESMISFLVTTNDSDLTESRRQKSLLTVGEKLCVLALSITPIGLGVAMWAREFTQGKEYAASASYPTLSHSILSLGRLVALRHPFARADVLHVGLAFIRHSNSEVSYQKVNSIKECALRLLIFLLIEGDIVPVFSALTQRVQQVGSSELDASLIRYFVAGILDVVQSPVSPIFMRMFGLFLMSSNVIDAVRSTYFAESNRKKLLALVNTFYSMNTSTAQNDSSKEEMRSLVSTLISTYR